MAVEFNRKSEAFLAWFKSLPGATFHEAIEIQDLRGQNAGRGIVATADIEPETVLFTIPRSAILCAATSKFVAEVPEIFNDNTEVDDTDDPTANNQDSWTSLILIMMHEYIRGESSPWKPYFDVLPTTFETLMFWSKDELKELQASHVVSKIGLDEADKMIRSKVLSVIHKHANVFYPDKHQRLSDNDLVKLAHQMGSTIMAYAFDLEKEEEEEEDEDEWVEDRDGKVMMGMVPMADILNADAEFNAHINHEEDALTATALRPIRAGEEILNYYGPLSNSELLRRYGYTTNKHGRYDVAELPWKLVLSSLESRLGLGCDQTEKIVQSLDQDDIEDSFVLDRNLDEADSTGRLPETGEEEHHFLLPEELEEQVKAFLKAARKVKPDALPDKHKWREVYLAVVDEALAARLGEYGTTIEQDRALLENSQGRLRRAVQVRAGEKALLLAARDAVATAARKLSEEAAADGEPAAKRHKR